MTDSHIHIGQFYNHYYQPMEVVRFLKSVSVDICAASSTTTCAGDFDRVLNEMQELQRQRIIKVMPVLWIIPSMFESGEIEIMLNSDIVWRCLKIHPQLNPKAWGEEGSNMRDVLTLARERKLPILIHTGETPGCYAGEFAGIIHSNPGINFILAHGRPIDQVISIMMKCSNCWTDTAFMPVRHIIKLCDNGLSGRVLWGTDYPIPRHFYPEKDMQDYYISSVVELEQSVSSEDFQKIIHDNFFRLFNM